MSFNPNDYANEYCTVEEVLEIKRVFDLFDLEREEAFEPRELIFCIRQLGIQEEKARILYYQLICQLDREGTGLIEFDIFFKIMTIRPQYNESRRQIHQLFVTFDKKRTGFNDLQDLRKVVKDLKEQSDYNFLQEMIERADFGQDGLVSKEQFYNLLTKKAY